MDGQTGRQTASTQTSQPQSGTTVEPFSPLDAVGVSEVMSLSPLFIVKQNDDRGDEINNLTGW